MKKASTTKHTQEAAGSSIPTNGKSDSGRNKIFDDIARVIGSNIPRRKALKLAVAGLAGAALVELGIRPAWAFETCDCNGQSYDTDVSCCTPSGVQQKHPIVDLNACPNKVAHPGFTAVPNGCGPSGSVVTPVIPNGFGAADFTPCCDTHDVCYGTCNTVKANCDNGFLTCLQGACMAAYSGSGISTTVKRNACLRVAGIYFSAVSNRGQNAYDAAQREACDCCATQSCSNCTPGTCGTFTQCAPNSDPPEGCFCFQTAEGGGKCSKNFFCASTAFCTSSSQCGSGSVCVVNTCCGPQGYCTPICTPSSEPITITSQPSSLDGPTAAGVPMVF